MNPHAVRQHFAGHPLHMAGCVLAAVLVVMAAVLGLPVLAVVGGLFCATMMIGMVWMMVAMATRNHHR